MAAAQQLEGLGPSRRRVPSGQAPLPLLVRGSGVAAGAVAVPGPGPRPLTPGAYLAASLLEAAVRVLLLGLVLVVASAATSQPVPPIAAGMGPDVSAATVGPPGHVVLVSLSESPGAVAFAHALGEAAGLRSGETAAIVWMASEPYTPSMDDVLRPAIWLGTRMAVVGFACGVVYSVGGLIVDAFTTGLNTGTALAFGALVGMPVVFGAAGFAAGGLGGAVAVGVRVLIGE